MRDRVSDQGRRALQPGPQLGGERGGCGGGPMAPPSPSCAQRWPGLFDRCSSGGSISHELRE